MDNHSSNKERIVSKLETYNKRKDFVDYSSKILKYISISISLFLIFSIIETLNYFKPSVRSILILIVIAFTLVTIIFESVKFVSNLVRAKSFRSISRAAEVIGTRFPVIKDRLLNALQIIRLTTTNHSKKLASAAFDEIYKKIENFDFNSIIDINNLKKNVILLTSILLFTLAIIFLIPPITEGAVRLLSYNTEFAKPTDFTLLSITEDQQIKKGENIELVFRAKGKSPNNILVSSRTNAETEFNSQKTNLDSNDLYSLKIRNVKSSFFYFAEKDEIKTDTFKISVVNPPIINDLKFEIAPPKYSRQKQRFQSNNGNIAALRGTKVSFTLFSSKNIKDAKRIYKADQYDSLETAGKKITGDFTIMGNDNYYFEIIDAEGNKNENPIEYEIKVIPDDHPSITVTRPDQTSLIPANDIVTITYSIKDDFGFSKVFLKYKLIPVNDVKKDEFDFIPLKFDPNNIDQSLFFNWDLTELNLRENEELNFYLEVFDNDYVGGPKASKSRLFKLRVPTLDELFAEADNTQESVLKELTETLSEAEQLQEDFKNIRDELKQDQEKLEWNEKERINNSVQKFEELTNKIEEIQTKLDDMRKKISENNLLSEETMQKYNELQDLMDELNSEDLQKALEDMQNSLENLLRDKVQKSLENLSINEEFFKNSIERTINLLKKIQIEQKMDELLKRSENLLSDLDKIQEQTQNLSDEERNSDQIVDESENIEKQLKSLKSGMEDLQMNMEEVSDMPSNEMQELNENFNQQQNEQLANQATNQLKEENLSDAIKSQEQISENINTLMSEMRDLQNQMQQKSQQMVMKNMLKSIENIISLSKEQEAFTDEIEKIKSRPKELPEKADIQMDMMQSLDKILHQLSELSQKTFAVTPEMGEALGNARRNMGQSISGMQNRNSQQSSFNQIEAMKNLNEAALLLQNSLKAMMQGGGQGGGMMSLMQQLQQMAQQQMGLNKLTQMMQSGQLTMQQQAQLQRLAQQQAALQKSLSELNQEARESGQSKKLSANLEKVLEEMKEVVSGLNTQKVDDNLIKKQEKILSKLLDAQRSINERDFDEKRESFSGDEFRLTSPADLLLENEESQDLLREELLRSIQNGYSKDYEDIIRRYFENLNQNTDKN